MYNQKLGEPKLPFFEPSAPRGELSQQFVAHNTRETTPPSTKKKCVQKQTYNPAQV